MSRSIPHLRLPTSTVVPVRRGHPWVFRDVVVPAEVGESVVLDAPDGTRVGWGIADEGDIAVRVLGVGDEAPDIRRALFERIQRADAVRRRVVDGDTDAYRVVAAAGDGLPGLIVDRYADVAVVRLYAAAWVPHLGTIRDAVRALGWPARVVRRLGVARVDGDAGLVPLAGPEDAGWRVVVQEHGMLLYVDVEHGQKTGTFLDQREHRLLVRRLSPGRQVVNLFSYHGGFSVAAALGGAASVVTVDLAPEAVEDARDNFTLNGLDPDAYGFEVADAFAWRAQGRPDLVVLDPPSLAHSRKQVGAARAAYRKLHRHHGAGVARDGLLASASCTSWMDAAGWHEAVEAGLSPLGPWSWLHRSATPPDHPVAMGHPEGWYLKFGLLRRR